MKLKRALVHNFGSYEQIDFEYDDKGLVLISGPTGSGKSTLCDIVPWALYGVTAKGGAVNEVVKWLADEPTSVTLEIEVNDKRYTIERRRNPNDLCYYDDTTGYQAGLGTRGKDLVDTQKLINDLIGMDAETYLAGAYFHEFSRTAQFFTAPAKIRRQITEQIVDLSLPKTLNDNMSLYKKETKEEIQGVKSELGSHNKKISYLQDTLKSNQEASDQWVEQQVAKEKQLMKQFQDFDKTKQDSITALMDEYELLEKERDTTTYNVLPLDYYTKEKQKIQNKIKALSDLTCNHCGAKKSNDQRLVLNKELYEIERLETNLASAHRSIEAEKRSLDYKLSRITKEIDMLVNSENTALLQLETLKSQENPYLSINKKISYDIKKTLADIDYEKKQLSALESEYNDTELLLSVVDNFRTELVKNTVVQLETSTNDLLTRFFDAEIRVLFAAEGADKLEVSILKDGNEASYTQLSKGQRQLLKLCFGVSVMKAVSNHKGVDFNCLFFDEATDGLSEELKVKAYRLLEELATAHSSIFLVEHSQELKNLFHNKIEVSLEDGCSRLSY